MPTSRRSLLSSEDQGATFVELFFDLVFVFAVTQVTGFLHHDLTPAGIGKAVLIFWMIWWAWTQFTWALNPANTDHAIVRLWTLVATGVAFIMALSVQDAFGDGGLLFAGSYVAGRVIGLVLYYTVASERPELTHAVRRFGLFSLGGLTLAVAGGFVDPDIRPYVWLTAVLLDMGAALIGGRTSGWGLHPGHFAERHGLFVIIALGESLIVAGVAASDQPFSTPLLLVVLGAVAVSCLLWWSYFGWLKEDLEKAFSEREGVDQSRFARNAYSFVHFPLIGSIIAVAIGIETMVAHPTEALEVEALAAFAAGIVLFVCSAAFAWWLARGRLLWQRSLIVLVMAAGLLFLPSLTPLGVLGIASVAMLLILVVEFVRCIEHVSEHET
ncbi:MAG: low temperature requirement protein A [Rubricoccaceae bacterium]|nr:low temperature requirement protein A [Rubricoccaceae bacterium]